MTGIPPEHDTRARVTVVVATRNRRDELLAHLQRHEGPVIVLDNASTDGSAEAVAAAYPDLTVVPLPVNVGARARTLGAERASTPYIAFADDDSWWAPGALDLAADVFDAHPRLGALAGSLVVGPEAEPDPINAVLADSPLGTPAGWPGPALLGFVACGTVVRRRAFLAVGGFDDVVRFPGEEERLALDLVDAGWQVAHVPAVVAHHHPSPHRDPDTRRQSDLIRSRILTALLRRGWPVVAREAGSAVLTAGGRRALVGALPRVPAALRARRRLAPATEAAIAVVESGGADSPTSQEPAHAGGDR
ncbi:glycosyl transferase [Tersicoccus phoenicis]|uniref:Glycosyl transferase n=1 Tax=Tersicoccus phoenicis TaxID=554083 RepID=A0A1R1LP39_9MICC|nr:glycosyltransferase [Tersicoccus phoenicis]OMH29311.1 glycosyl transferase [Tersicoccus phoenicis]